MLFEEFCHKLDEEIHKRDGKYVVTKSGGKGNLGKHDTLKDAEKQLTAIHLSQAGLSKPKKKKK